ncbi:uncharacterized protein RJT20DRAFT_137546 [Scheffersomyces xylosifermentans]|uniref:uncharacterized protein n=1 Tax=Scheffersomyces xylosifermentans TaxID=1304137 RepID=UPI00315DE997
MSESAISRPTTALMKVIDKFSYLSGLKLPASSSPSSAILLDGNEDKNVAPTNQSAQQLEGKIAKILKIDKKLHGFKTELAGDFINWANSIPSKESQMLIKEFAALLLTQESANTVISDKLEKVKISLSLISEREKRRKESLSDNIKLTKEHKENETRFGSNASSSTLISEKLEINGRIINLGEEQFIRAISNELREAIIEYLNALSASTKRIEEATSNYSKFLSDLDPYQVYLHSSPKKYQGSPVHRSGAVYSSAMSYGSPNKPKSEPFTNRENRSKVLDNQYYEGKSSPCDECRGANHSRMVVQCNHQSKPGDDQNNPTETAVMPPPPIPQRGTQNIGPSRISSEDMRSTGFQNGYEASEHW